MHGFLILVALKRKQYQTGNDSGNPRTRYYLNAVVI